jgi:hypothetical protein
LLTAAIGPLDLPDPHGKAGGIQYDPVSCGHAHLYPPECGPDLDPPTSKVFDPANAIIERAPFIAYASYVCGAAGYTAAELNDKVLRRLANGEQTIAEQALAGLLATAATPLLAPDPADIVSVIGDLEQWLYGAGSAAYGNVGYLHASPRVAAAAAAAHLIVADTGPLLRTRMGTVWVFGGGYPDGTVYISGQTTVWRAADVFSYPAEQVFDRAANQYRLVAEREYAVSYDCVAAKAAWDFELAS